MYFKQFYLGCLAQASYLVGDGGEAAVVDPRRDVEEYLAEAEAQGLRIRYVIETHLHADFVSGHRELAEKTGAEILISARAGATFPHRGVREGDEVELGRLRLRFLETPGHTPESVCVVVTDTAESPRPRLVFTGDTLFIGDVGRPDLVGAQGYTPETMAGLLYDSLHDKLLTLPDEVAVYPAHGAGSLCGRSLSSERSSTIGEQRRGNYALRPMDRAQFVNVVTADLPEAPRYFPLDVALNRQGAAAVAQRAHPPALSPAQVAEAAAKGAAMLDVRGGPEFGAGHLPAAVNVGLAGQFASWAGILLDASRPLVIVADDAERAEEAVMRLARVGLENVAGFLDGGVLAWERDGRPLERLPQIAVDELRARLAEDPALQVLDVRRPAEYAGGHVPGARPAPLDSIERELAQLDDGRPTAVICAGGYRSSAACSLLQRSGFEGELFNVVGGTSAWMAAGYPTEE